MSPTNVAVESLIIVLVALLMLAVVAVWFCDKSGCMIKPFASAGIRFQPDLMSGLDSEFGLDSWGRAAMWSSSQAILLQRGCMDRGPRRGVDYSLWQLQNRLPGVVEKCRSSHADEENHEQHLGHACPPQECGQGTVRMLVIVAATTAVTVTITIGDKPRVQVMQTRGSSTSDTNIS